MPDNIGFRFLLLAFIIALNGFFAGAEVALLSARRARLQHLAEEGNVGAQAAINLLSNPERLLSVVQVGVTLTSLGLGWAGEDTLFGLFAAALGPVWSEQLAPVLHGVALVGSFALMTFAHVVLGEVVPKNLAIEKADRLSMMVAPALLVFYRITEPFVFAIERTATGLSRLIGLSGESHTAGHTAEELKHIVEASRRELRPIERAVLSRTLELRDLSAREVMVPRHDVVSVPADASLEHVLRAFLEHQFSRMPVWEDKPENIIGIVHFKDLIRVWEERRLAKDRNWPVRPFRLKRTILKPLVVPETKELPELLEEFRQERTHMALVVDEFGTISGLVTFEDVLEQILGEIEDEHDELRSRPIQIGGVLELIGTTPIRDLQNQYGIELPTDAGFETLAGFLLHHFRDLPQEGESIEYEGRTFVVTEMERNRIGKVRIETPLSLLQNGRGSDEQDAV
jgi:CBS domain containing-hemolysin-like protein